jgi:hypothetical protein
LSAQRIYQDLVEKMENGFAGSYQSVKRFVRGRKAGCRSARTSLDAAILIVARRMCHIA